MACPLLRSVLLLPIEARGVKLHYRIRMLRPKGYEHPGEHVTPTGIREPQNALTFRGFVPSSL
jgi:hypothetical protein